METRTDDWSGVHQQSISYIVYFTQSLNCCIKQIPPIHAHLEQSIKHLILILIEKSNIKSSITYNPIQVQMQPPTYHDQIGKKMTQLFYRYQDFMLNMHTPIKAANPNRQSVLTRNYLMQKKGKTLGTTQERSFRIHQGILKQVDKSGQERDLPMPKSITSQKLQSNSTDWLAHDHPFRILMTFQQRTPIYVYFRTSEEFGEVRSFISSTIHPSHQQALKACFDKFYQPKLINYFISKISTIKLSKNYGNLDKKRGSLVNRMGLQFGNANMVTQLLLRWHQRATMTPKDPEKAQESEDKNLMSVKNIVSQLAFNLHRIKGSPDLSFESGELKVWVGQMTYSKIFKFSPNQATSQYFGSVKKGESTGEKYKVATIIGLQDVEVKLRNQSPVLSIWTTLQFQAEMRNEQGENRSWRSERFYVLDLLKSLVKGPRKVINLWSGRHFLQLQLTATSAKCQALKISLPPEHEQFPSSYMYNLSPNMYPILRQIIPKQIVTKYIKSINPQTIHLQYTIAYQQYLQNEATESLCYTSLFKLYDLLQIDAILDKFYTTAPYDQYAHLQNKATVVYECLARKSSKFAYYDAEKFIWKYRCAPLRRFLSSIKAFDEFPRINYTEPFFFLCLQCMKLAQKQSMIKWKSGIFSNSLLGRESLAFFIVLGLLKTCSQLLLFQPNKTTLANNSLLFHYTLKKHCSKLYNKYLEMQLNIEAFFGIESSSLFAGLLNNNSAHLNRYGGSDQVFIFILTSLITERREQNLKASEQMKNQTMVRNNHYVSLISAFLSILQLFDNVVAKKNAQCSQHAHSDELIGNSCAYRTANNYMKYLGIFACTELQSYFPQFWQAYDRYYNLCISEMKESEYLNLQQNLEKFHSQNSLFSSQQSSSNGLNSMKLSDLMEQLHSEFSCYKPKNEDDIRKINIILDNINLGEYLLSNSQNLSNSTVYRPASLLIQVIQSSIKLYEHEYIIPHKLAATEPYMLTYDNIKHEIELKLNRLSSLTLLITYNHNGNSIAYGTLIDPKQVPSNYYIQQVKQLLPFMLVNGIPHLRITELATNHRYVCLQLFIKDSCDVDYLENSVPTSYINCLLLRDRLADNRLEDYRKDVIFCNQYFRSFRLMENNFNLLYAKLGWYGNHYLIPADRITSIYLSRRALSHSPGSSQNSTQTLVELASSNISEYVVTQLPQVHRQRVNEILFYTRCIFGRGVVSSVAFNGNSGTQLIVESIRNNKVLVKENKDMKNEINEFQYSSCGNLAAYLLDNFKTVQNETSLTNTSTRDLSSAQKTQPNSFINFYLRCTQQLPLIRHLCFRPLEFYLLEQIRLTLKVLPSNQSSSNVDLRNYSSNPVNSSTAVKNKAIVNTQFQKKSVQDFYSVSTNNYAKTFEIVLTNHPVKVGSSSESSYQLAHKFISSPSYFNQQLYTNFDPAGLDQNINQYNTKNLYLKLLESSSLPSTLYFTYPECIQYRFSHEDVEAMGATYGVNGSTDMLIDQFLWLLQMNIIKYYIIDAADSSKKQGGKQKPKNKERGKQRSMNNEILGCQLKFGDASVANTSVWRLYEFICETKLQLELIASPIYPVQFVQAYQSAKNIQPCCLTPILLNPIYRHYTSFAFYNGIWIEVCILAKIVSPTHVLFYVEEKQTRRYRLFRSVDVVLGLQAKRMLDRLACFKFTDFQVLSGKQCVRKQLIRIL